MLDAEDLSSLVPVPPKDGRRKRRAAPRQSTLRRLPLTAPKAISADDAFGHLSSLTSGMSPRTVDGLIKAVRKEAADYVVAREKERSADVKREREAAAKARRGSVVASPPRRASVTGAGAAAAAGAVPDPAPSDTASGRVSPGQPDGLSPRRPPSGRAGARPARDHALQLEEAQRAAAAERLAQCRRLAALPSGPTPDDFVTLGAHYAQQGEHDRAAATFFQGLFRDSNDQVLAERFRESLAAIARMRHPDQTRPDNRFLPELHDNKGHGNRHGLTTAEEGAHRRQPGRSLLIKDIRLDGLASQNGPIFRVRHGGGDVWSEQDEGTELCRHDLDHLCRIPSLIVHGIADAGEEAHHSRDASARRLRPDGALRAALSTPREMQMFPRARWGLPCLLRARAGQPHLLPPD